MHQFFSTYAVAGADFLVGLQRFDALGYGTMLTLLAPGYFELAV
jgi:hypothetical protein